MKDQNLSSSQAKKSNTLGDNLTNIMLELTTTVGDLGDSMKEVIGDLKPGEVVATAVKGVTPLEGAPLVTQLDFVIMRARSLQKEIQEIKEGVDGKLLGAQPPIQAPLFPQDRNKK